MSGKDENRRRHVRTDTFASVHTCSLPSCPVCRIVCTHSYFIDEGSAAETEPITLASNFDDGLPMGFERHRPAAEKFVPLIVPLIAVRHRGPVDIKTIVNEALLWLMEMSTLLDTTTRPTNAFLILGGTFFTATGHVNFSCCGNVVGTGVFDHTSIAHNQPCFYCHKKPGDVDAADGIASMVHQCAAIPTSTLQRLFYGPYRRMVAYNIQPFKVKMKAMDISIRVMAEVFVYDGGAVPEGTPGSKIYWFIRKRVAVDMKGKPVNRLDDRDEEKDPKKEASEEKVSQPVEVAVPEVGRRAEDCCGEPRRRRAIADGM